MKLDYAKLASEILKKVSNQRTKDIISSRFGLADGQRQTLEAIGQKYGITRERVRQIEEAAFSDFRSPESFKLFKPAFCLVDNFLNSEGRLVRENRMLSVLTGFEDSHPSRGALFLILTLGKPYQHFVESDKFYSLWTNSLDALKQADQAINRLVNLLEGEESLVPFKCLSDLLKKENINLSRKALFSYLDVTKQVDRNFSGYFGLSKWPEINPRGARDKAYIILKGQNRPLHFRKITDLINQSNLSSILAQAQTVHNELIKDDRFVLVGRGTYALKDWGYQAGTVRQVITQLLKESGPLTKEDILEKVLKDRLVKKSTILINLQNRKYFNRDKQGKYILAV
jgi:predicted Zn-ribbon and HTH transcriptional regulator